MNKKQTEKGEFVQDQSGLWHYTPTDHVSAYITRWIVDALANMPDGPAWFWFNNLPAPIVPTDSPETVERRWYKVNNPYKDQVPFLKSLLEFISEA